MQAIEKDAQERSERKRAAKGEATVYKDAGNEAFKSGDYLKAVELYTQVSGLLELNTLLDITTTHYYFR